MKTRLIAQVLAAVIGAGFLIAAQVAAILTQGSLSRFAIFTSNEFMRSLPAQDSVVWIPARAATGEPGPLLLVVCGAALALISAISLTARRFGEHIVAASSVAQARIAHVKAATGWRNVSPARALREKEWKLLARDPWLVSQTLMQVLYLLPPAVLLWRNYGDTASIYVVLSPVLVMALGQLAGGLAWLAVSGEDAPDLISSAPLPSGATVTAKIEAVLAIVAVAAAPFLIAMLFHALVVAAAVAAGILLSAASAIAIQLWYRAPASRIHFRRRQTASKVATFAEAFSSIMWAGATGLAVAQSWFCLLFGVMSVTVLVIAWTVSPARRT